MYRSVDKIETNMPGGYYSTNEVVERRMEGFGGETFTNTAV